ncbi:MAG: DOMON-like domain-containing protein [Chloroflexota bacterium]
MIATPFPSPVALVSHSDTPCAAVESIQSFLSWERSAVLAIRYVIEGAIGQVRIPAYQSARRADGLWRHTCFEAFIGAKNDAEYYEFNLSPSGDWAVYGFRNYRDGGLIEDSTLEPTVSVRREERALELRTKICLDRLPGLQLDVCLWVGLAAVIEDNDGRLSYWALKHVPGKPDFHHSDTFVLEIIPPVAGAGAIA